MIRTICLILFSALLTGCQVRHAQQTAKPQDTAVAQPMAQSTQPFIPDLEIFQDYLAGGDWGAAPAQESRIESALRWAVEGYFRAHGRLPDSVQEIYEAGLVLLAPTWADGTPIPLQVVDTLPAVASPDTFLLAKEGMMLRGWLPPTGPGSKALKVVVNMQKLYDIYAPLLERMPLVPGPVLANRVTQEAAVLGVPVSHFANQYLHSSDSLADQRVRVLLAMALGLCNADAARTGRAPEDLQAAMARQRVAFQGVTVLKTPVDLLERPLGVQLLTSPSGHRLQLVIKPSIPGVDYQLVEYSPDYTAGRVGMADLSSEVAPQEAGCHDLVATLVLQ